MEKLITADLFFVAAIKALTGVVPEMWEETIVDQKTGKRKFMAVYQNKNELPALANIKIIWDGSEKSCFCSINDFKYAFFEIKDEISKLMETN